MFNIEPFTSKKDSNNIKEQWKSCTSWNVRKLSTDSPVRTGTFIRKNVHEYVGPGDGAETLTDVIVPHLRQNKI